MIRRLRIWLFGTSRRKYYSTQRPHWNPGGLRGFQPHAEAEYALVGREVPSVRPQDFRLPAHQTVTVDPREHADAWPTQNLPAIREEVPEPVRPVMGRDLLTGEPRMFGLPAMAMLHGVHAALTLQTSLYFPGS